MNLLVKTSARGTQYDGNNCCPRLELHILCYATEFIMTENACPYMLEEYVETILASDLTKHIQINRILTSDSQFQ